MSLKVVSLNVQSDKHLERVIPFIERENPDLVALMEVCEDNLDELLSDYPERIFAPNFQLDDGRKVGVVIASKQTFAEQSHFYADELEGDIIPLHGMGTHRPVVVRAKIGGIELAATHFTWTPNMTDTDKQLGDLERLLEEVGEQQIVLCGDFNMPRGNIAYKRMADRYRDWIPADVQTTIDPYLHRANKLKKDTLVVVVDYIWTTSRYGVENVRIVDGISDHCAVVAELVSVK